VVLAIFLLGIATLTVYTVAMLADARSVVSHIKEILAADGDISGIDRTVINRAIYFVSISLAVNGSLFFILAGGEEQARGVLAQPLLYALSALSAVEIGPQAGAGRTATERRPGGLAAH
jgi:hypothetical protein